MHGINAELMRHPHRIYCGCPGTEMHGTFIKKLTNKKERHETRQLLHILKQDIDSLDNHLDYQFINNEEVWTTRLDSC